MRHYLLFYDLAPDFAARRAPLRQVHLDHAWAASDRGDLVLAGALAGPADGGILLFRAPGPEVAEAFAPADPYVTGGLVSRWRVQEWVTAVGADACAPTGRQPPATA